MYRYALAFLATVILVMVLWLLWEVSKDDG